MVQDSVGGSNTRRREIQELVDKLEDKNEKHSKDYFPRGVLEGLRVMVNKGPNTWFQTVMTSSRKKPTSRRPSTTMKLGLTRRVSFKSALEIGSHFKIWAAEHTMKECRVAAQSFRRLAQTEIDKRRHVSLGELENAWHRATHGGGSEGDKKPRSSIRPTRVVRRYGRPTTRTLNTILYGPPGTGKTYLTAGRCVEICGGERNDGNIRKRYRELVKRGRVKFATFHQSYGYEEFVEGLRPAPNKGGKAGFRLVPTDGMLKRIAERAGDDSENAYVLVIDEINRANISKVLGELTRCSKKTSAKANRTRSP